MQIKICRLNGAIKCPPTFVLEMGYSRGVWEVVLSPALFNLYMNDLSVQLKGCKTGYMIGNTPINHLIYADELFFLRAALVFNSCRTHILIMGSNMMSYIVLKRVWS